MRDPRLIHRNRRETMRTVLIILGIVMLAQPALGWDFTRHSVPLEDIQSGGPPKDGIPALLEPNFTSAGEASELLRPDDRVIGVSVEGSARAYPIRVLNYHELANDKIGGAPLLVSW